MKNSTHYFTLAVLVAIFVLGCVTPRQVAPTDRPVATDDLKARIDSAVRDRGNWVDPALKF